jgi:hypothetical protein
MRFLPWDGLQDRPRNADSSARAFKPHFETLEAREQPSAVTDVAAFLAPDLDLASPEVRREKEEGALAVVDYQHLSGVVRPKAGRAPKAETGNTSSATGAAGGISVPAAPALCASTESHPPPELAGAPINLGDRQALPAGSEG